MGTVGTTALLGCLIDLDVLDDQVAGVEAFGVRVRFGVLEEAEEELGGLFRPAGFGDAELFTCAIFQSQYCLQTSCKRDSDAELSEAQESVFPTRVLSHRCPRSHQYPTSTASSHVPCAVLPVLPAYRLMGTASL